MKGGGEERLHGRRWDAIHGGYFSDPAVAAPLLAEIRRLAARSRARVIADLGGGTGRLLLLLRAGGLPRGIRLVNLEPSARQAAEARRAGLATRRASLENFARRQAAPPGTRLLLVLRSVLHYLGRKGLPPALARLRRQLGPGEYLVHQTACCRGRKEADCLNALYRMLGTGKWYPTRRELRAALAQAGWRVARERPAPPIHLSSAELAERYGIAAAGLKRIGRILPRDFPAPPGVFRLVRGGFAVRLPYRIFACAPKGQGRKRKKAKGKN